MWGSRAISVRLHSCLARAFDEELQNSSDIVSAIEQYFANSGLSNKNAKFADKLSMIPKSAELLWSNCCLNGKQIRIPVVRLHNVIALPGVPIFCEQAFDEIKGQVFPLSLKPLFSETLYTSQDELKFAQQLSKIASRYDGVVEIGSYPVINNSSFKTKLILDSESAESGRAAVDDVIMLLGDTLVYYDDEPWIDTSTKFSKYRERELSKNSAYVLRLDEALQVLRRTIERYPLDQIALSFNGGKDCTVLLHLFRLVVDELFGPEVEIQGFHIVCGDQFPEATQFIIDAARNYNMVMTEYPGPLKAGLKLMKKRQPNVVAVLLGSRASDPRGNRMRLGFDETRSFKMTVFVNGDQLLLHVRHYKMLKSHIEWTDEDWPKILRVCPILLWSYRDVWSLLRGLCVPYCPLYDMGYTSLGGRTTTIRNPLLKIVEKDGVER
uniref:FAD synthase n=1 Tax=Angiostrongylus cantonensis TaxID=6313 RepID=A0A0K0DG44_ANGCA